MNPMRKNLHDLNTIFANQKTIFQSTKRKTLNPTICGLLNLFFQIQTCLNWGGRSRTLGEAIINIFHMESTAASGYVFSSPSLSMFCFVTVPVTFPVLFMLLVWAIVWRASALDYLRGCIEFVQFIILFNSLFTVHHEFERVRLIHMVELRCQNEPHWVAECALREKVLAFVAQ